MPPFEQQLLDAAERVLIRGPGQRGMLPIAHVRRSISTSYYALFHFLISEACVGMLGRGGHLATRRQMFGRSFNHRGIKDALRLVKARTVDNTVNEFMRFPASSVGPVQTPPYAHQMAGVFLDAQSKRHAADYDLTETFTEREARAMIDEIRRAIEDWSRANTQPDRMFKRGLYALTLIGGRLRSA